MFTLRSRQAGFALHTVLILLATITGVIVIGLFTKNQTEISKERQQFLAAQKEVDALGDKLAKATNPDKHGAVAFCSYSSAKYGKGTRFCWSKYYLVYLNTDEKNALNKFTEAEKIFGESKKYSVRDSEYMSSLKNLAFQSALDEKCSVAVYYNETQNSNNGVPSFTQPANSSSIVVSCSGEAKAEHFPVKE